jgi:hypothetical protein
MHVVGRQSLKVLKYVNDVTLSLNCVKSRDSLRLPLRTMIFHSAYI